ncbi:MAG: BspA family leucine-rich repeat surface protein [Clostridia bacterium]|nr:BspA family leucine-rich repeat surface protein [Clostridia bacterium]
MTNKKTTKRALIASVISLLLCFTMLLGTTYAWFTDSVTSTGNIIKTGNLDVEMYWADGTKAVPADENGWTDASTGAIFDYQNWEPGYTEVRHIKIANEGTLSFKYKVIIAAEGEFSDLVDVIDVYYYDPAEQIANRNDLGEDTAYGTLREALDGMVDTANGTLAGGEAVTVTIALKMRESAGNDYENKSVGAFSIQVLATQNPEEEDSFDDQYDADAEWPPIIPSVSVMQSLLEDGENPTGKVIFGTFSEYADDVEGYTGTDVNGDGSLMVYRVPSVATLAENSAAKDTVYFLAEDKIALPANSSKMFYEMGNLTEIDASNLDFSNVTNAFCMFAYCANLTSIKGTENWDLSNVTNMQSFFYGCNKLTDIDVSEWDTSNVTNMRMVFFRCYALDNETLKGVESWDVSNVSNFYSMFKHARGLTSLDLSNWDTSSATNMSHLFANIGGLEYLDLSGFDTSKVTDMSWMFYDGSKLTTILVGDGWTTAALDPAKPTCFYNNQALVGGNGTAWLDVCDMANANRPWESSAKLVYAVVDGGEAAPGLLTYKSAE